MDLIKEDFAGLEAVLAALVRGAPTTDEAIAEVENTYGIEVGRWVYAAAVTIRTDGLLTSPALNAALNGRKVA